MGVGEGEGAGVGVGTGRGGRGGLTNVKAADDVTAPVSTFATLTSTEPGAADGVTTEISVALNAVTVPATPPNVTDAPDSNSVPVIVTAVPPLEGPEFGCTEVMVGVDGVAN